MPSIYPSNDELFVNWLTNFITVANANLAALSYTAADITAITAYRDNLQAAINSENTAREAAIAATTNKKLRRKTANEQTSFRAKVIVANPNIPANIKAQLGLNVPTPSVSSAPVAPKNLVVVPRPTGINTLSWESNGNKSGTTYIIEQKRSQNGAWTIAGASTTRAFAHTGQTPGRHVIYRVKAQRIGLTSDVSNDATAYGNAAFPLEDNGIE